MSCRPTCPAPTSRKSNPLMRHHDAAATSRTFPIAPSKTRSTRECTEDIELSGWLGQHQRRNKQPCRAGELTGSLTALRRRPGQPHEKASTGKRKLDGRTAYQSTERPALNERDYKSLVCIQNGAPWCCGVARVVDESRTRRSRLDEKTPATLEHSGQPGAIR